MELPALPASSPAPGRAHDPELLMQRARELEAVFLAEMLAHAGLGPEGGGFLTGAAELQFGTFLRAEQARLLAERGGIGLAEMLFRAMEGR